jgi:NADPH-dependent glutamate synthase beta subunit-like oxidoreductase
MICDHPCESCCVRQEPQDAIAISELEKAVIALGYAPPKRNIPIPKNKGRVAVAGGGLSGLTAACDLDKKGYQVVIYEKEDRIGGRIWKYEGAYLGRETILEQLGVIEKNGIRVELNTF